MLLLAGYLLLFPPLFVLGPLAGLLLASRPATLREWAWIGAAGLWLALSVAEPAGLALQAQQAWALFVTAGFVVLMLFTRTGVVAGALGAVLAALALVTVWIQLLGIGWQEIQIAATHQGWEACRALLAWGQGLSPARQEDLRASVDTLSAVVAMSAELLPAMLVLKMIPGLAIAWGWYHRLAARPTGWPGGSFADFRFNDQLVWVVVLGVAGIVLPVPAEVHDVLANLMVIAGGLYIGRGAAITWGPIQGLPGLVLLIIAAGVLFILPVALGGWFALGLADTWVDFRRRFRPAGQTRE
jgi:hypothetical protein